MFYVDLPLQNQYFCTHWGLSKKECIQTFLKLSQFFLLQTFRLLQFISFFVANFQVFPKRNAGSGTQTLQCVTRTGFRVKFVFSFFFVLNQKSLFYLLRFLTILLFCNQSKKFILFVMLFYLNAKLTWQIIKHNWKVTRE